MKFHTVIFFFLSIFISIMRSDLIAIPVAFIVRSDYIKDHACFKQIHARCSITASQTFNEQVAHLKNEFTEAPDSKKTDILVQLLALCMVNDRLNNVINDVLADMGSTLDDIEPLYVKNDQRLCSDVIALLDPAQLPVVSALLENVITKSLIANTRLFAVTKRYTWFGRMVPVGMRPCHLCINESVFLGLNDLLNLCKQVVIYYLADMIVAKKILVLGSLSTLIDGYKSRQSNQALRAGAERLLLVVNTQLAALQGTAAPIVSSPSARTDFIVFIQKMNRLAIAE